MARILCLLVGLSCVAYSQAACTVAVTADFAAETAGVVDSASTTETLCEAACVKDPRCFAYDFTASSTECELHTGKTAYTTIAAAGTSHGELTACTYWNYAGHNIGCGSTYTADTTGTLGVTITASDRWSCWYQCLEYPRCLAWSWTVSSSTCTLFSEDGATAVAAAGTEFHKIICPTEPFNSFLSGYEYWPMFRVNGAKLQAGTFTFIECQTLCDGDATCQAIDWDVDKEACWIHIVRANGKDTSCVNKPKWSPNMYHIKKNTCASYPAPPFVI